MIKTRLTYANVMSAFAVFLGLGGVSYAAVAIPNNSVGSAQLKDGQVMAADLNEGTRNSLKSQIGAKGQDGAAGGKGADGSQGARGATGNFIGSLPAGSKIVNGYVIGAHSDLHGADLHGMDLHGLNLSHATLTGADLRGANLHAANLAGTDLHGMNFTEMNLSSANLSGANLSGANLHNADLGGCDLTYSNLSGAYWHGTLLNDANLFGATGVSLTDLISPDSGDIVGGIGGTTLPDGTLY
ncbi:MAG: hypothetical protein F2799_00030 [Actinobacteria bacterium]|uniref:Unannotated protein n=1 Tax=freshwater metagenome TaxID=449393 RepID=A0A6J7CIW8_9ZZZZ|nr:hypothetical protein [Actinomycetota bacterium]